jgi:DNA-binding GntR family transcriptional regulator
VGGAPGEPDEPHDPRPISVEQLTEALQNLILSGTLATGSWLRQERLATEFGVSRTPIREALRVLQARGLIELHPNRGALVCRPTARDIREAYAVRAELEGFASELAAEWARDGELEQLAAAAAAFERLVLSEVARPSPVTDHERPQWQTANDRFHLAILDAAGNHRLKAMIEELHARFPRNLTWSALAGHSLLLGENVDQHRRILQAIDARDPAGARAAMVAHVRRAGDLVARHFDALASSDPDTHRI